MNTFVFIMNARTLVPCIIEGTVQLSLVSVMRIWGFIVNFGASSIVY